MRNWREGNQGIELKQRTALKVSFYISFYIEFFKRGVNVEKREQLPGLSSYLDYCLEKPRRFWSARNNFYHFNFWHFHLAVLGQYLPTINKNNMMTNELLPLLPSSPSPPSYLPLPPLTHHSFHSNLSSLNKIFLKCSRLNYIFNTQLLQ